MQPDEDNEGTRTTGKNVTKALLSQLKWMKTWLMADP